MNKKGRSQLALGVILILLGAWFLADKSIPAFHSFFDKYTEWPVNMLLIGGVIFILGLVLGQPGMSVPAAIVAGLGGMPLATLRPGHICGRSFQGLLVLVRWLQVCWEKTPRRISNMV